MSNFFSSIEIFKALSDPTRVRIMKLLVINNSEMCVCEFSDVLCQKPYNLSKHLKILENANLLNSYKEGRWVYFGLANKSKPVFEMLLKLISEITDFNDQLAGDQERFEQRITLRKNGRCLGSDVMEANLSG